MKAALVVLLLAGAAVAGELRPLVGVRVEGHTKVTDATALRLAHVDIGDPVRPEMSAQLAASLLSSELFKKVDVHLEEVPGGYVLVATLTDKLSWIVAPTLYLLPSSWSVGAGYAENDLFGNEKKLLLYGQVGNKSSLFFGTYFDPAVHGSRLMLRFDLYADHTTIYEYANPVSDPTNFSVARSTKWNFLDAGFLAGWRFFWWLSADVRYKPAYAFFTHLQADDPSLRRRPERDGIDNTFQTRITLDHRRHRYGVTWGTFAQLSTDVSLPGDDYGYQLLGLHVYQSWRFFAEHQLEIRVGGGIGRHLPFHEELNLGGVSDLRGYITDQFRGDRSMHGRVEYSVPIAKWRIFAFRAISFFDAGRIGFHWRDHETRDYLPSEANGLDYTRSDVGAGFRVYVGSVVLPLLGLDLGYGLEGHHPEIYFEVGLTDF